VVAERVEARYYAALEYRGHASRQPDTIPERTPLCAIQDHSCREAASDAGIDRTSGGTRLLEPTSANLG
jgi:hypothetical protein